MCDCDCGHHDWEEESVHGELVYDLKDRPIHPLPKRKRIAPLSPHPVRQLLAPSVKGDVGDPYSDPEDDLDLDGRDRRSTRAQLSNGQDPVLDTRTAGDQDYGDGRDSYSPRKRTESPAALRRPTERRDSTGSHSLAPLSPCASSPSTPSSPCSESYPDADEQTDFGLFGAEGHKIAKSLGSASSFSTAGLFGGLGLAGLHPTSGSVSDDRHYFEEEEDGDEDTYGVVDRSRPPVEPTHATTIAATALGLGASNKKKRKIPGIAAMSAQPPVPTTALPPPHSPKPTIQNRTRAREEEPSPTRDPVHRSATEWLPLKAPVNPPTTAKAALAKLRTRPPHVSLCRPCFSSRRHRRKRFRLYCSKQQPLPLPSAPDFVPPAMPREGPPKLPPGSGLKGSKALKAAAKLAKEREKEKERIRTLFKGIKLPDLYDPEGRENPPPYIVSRLITREVEKKRAEFKDVIRGRSESPKSPSGYPTPPASSDDGEDEQSFPWGPFTRSPPELDSFAFQKPAPNMIEMRWKHLCDQKERVKAAKERAAKAREEEKQRKKEKEERDQAEKAAAVAVPPTPAATPQRKSQANATAPKSMEAPRLPPPASSPPSNSLSTTDLPPAPPPAAALPSPPLPQSPLLPLKAPLKKGRKKRSAHANAHNVHHRDNYVPSRLPSTPVHHTTSLHGGEASLGPTTWPASEEAIAAAGPYAGTGGGGHYCDPDEWLCVFCEYQLFYGEEPALYRAARKRKEVLKVRQKAKDRAMKATHGKATTSIDIPVGIAGEGGDQGGPIS